MQRLCCYIFIKYFLHVRESKILHYFDYLKHEKDIPNKILKQWRVGNGLADLGYIYCGINKIRGID